MVSFAPLVVCTWTDFLQTAMVALTFFAILVALFGNWARTVWLFPPKLRLELIGEFGQTVAFKPVRTYFHLRLINRSRATPGKNCRVMLRKFERVDTQSQLHNVPFEIPLQLTWSPSESQPFLRNIANDETVVLGYLENPQAGAAAFTPQFYVTPMGWKDKLSVKPGGTARYYLQVDADNFTSSEYQVFEVSWDGAWHDDPEELRVHLKIIERAPVSSRRNT